MFRRRFLTFAIVISSVFLVAAPVGMVWLVSERSQQQTDMIAHVSHASDLNSCRARNQLRDGIIDYITSLDAARRRAALATVVAPLASPEEKQTAITNLHALDFADRQAHRKFVHERC